MIFLFCWWWIGQSVEAQKPDSFMHDNSDIGLSVLWGLISFISVYQILLGFTKLVKTKQGCQFYEDSDHQ